MQIFYPEYPNQIKWSPWIFLSLGIFTILMGFYVLKSEPIATLVCFGIGIFFIGIVLWVSKLRPEKYIFNNKLELKRKFLPNLTIDYSDITDMSEMHIATKKGYLLIGDMKNQLELVAIINDLKSKGIIKEVQFGNTLRKYYKANTISFIIGLPIFFVTSAILFLSGLLPDSLSLNYLFFSGLFAVILMPTYLITKWIILKNTTKINKENAPKF